MRPSDNGSDFQRDAIKFGRLLNALRRAIDAIRNLEAKSQPNIDDVLIRLLPDLAKALEGQVAFVARVADSDQAEMLQRSQGHGYEVVASYPNDAASQRQLPSSELLNTLIRDGKPRVIAPLGGEETTLIAGLELFQATSAILVRVMTERHVYVVGVCNKLVTSDVPFLAADRMTLHSLLELVAVGARVGERRQSELRSIQDVLVAVSDEINLDELLPLIVRHAARVFHDAAISLMLWDDQHPRLTVAAVHGLSEEYRVNYALPGDIVAQQLGDEHGVTHIADLSTSRLGDGKWIRDEGVTSALLVPMLVGEQLIGLLNVYARDATRVFSALEQDLAKVFAGEAAIALKNARLYRRRVDEQAAIQRIGEASTRGDISKVWQTIAELTIRLTKASSVTLISVDRDADQLIVRGTWDRKQSRWVPRINEEFELDESSMNGHVALSGEPYYVADVAEEHEHFNPDVAVTPSGIATRSAYCVPLKADDKVLGTIYVASDRKDGIHAEDRRFIDSLMPHAAVALFNAELLAQAQIEKEKREQLITIQGHAIEIQQSIADILDVSDQVAQIREKLQPLFRDISGMFIATYDETTRTIELPKVYDRNNKVEDDDPRKQPGQIYGPRRLGDCSGIVDYVINTGQGVLIRDFPKHPLWILIDEVYRKGVRSCVAAPMRIQGKIKGVIGLRSYRRTDAYNEYDQFLLATVADQIATVIENSRQYELRLKELRAVSDFQERISELDVGTSSGNGALPTAETSHHDEGTVTREIRNIYRIARDAMSQVNMYTDDMYIALYDPDAHSIEFPLVYDENRSLSQAEICNHQRFRAYRDRQVGDYPDLTEYLATGRDRGALLFSSRRELESFVSRTPEVKHAPNRSKSWLGTPMIMGDRSIGMIGLRHFEEEHCFNEHHQELLQIIARQAAIVIENARLYDSSRRQLETLGRSNAIALMGAWGADMVHEVNGEVGNIQRGLEYLRLLTGRAHDISAEAAAQIDDLIERADQMASPEWLEELSLDDDTRYRTDLNRPLALELERMRSRHPDIQFFLEATPYSAYVFMHEKWLRRIARHLLSNAVHSIMAGGKEQGHITVTTEYEEQVARIIVRDNGKGLRPEIRQLLFRQPIPHQSEDYRHNHGRGLLLLHYVVEAHGGKITLEWSEVGEGACFCVELPARLDLGPTP